MTCGRYERMCPTHGRLLEGLECPVGPHHVETWTVVDTQKDEAVGQATAVTSSPGMTAHAGKLRRVSSPRDRQAPEERQERMEQRDTQPGPSSSSGHPSKVTYVGPAGKLVVNISLRKSGTVVRWTMTPAGGGRKLTGLLYQGADRDAAADAWRRALAEALAQGWKERSEYTPIPSAELPPTAARPARASPAPSAGNRSGCGKCGGKGHNARTCGRKARGGATRGVGRVAARQRRAEATT